MHAQDTTESQLPLYNGITNLTNSISAGKNELCNSIRDKVNNFYKFHCTIFAQFWMPATNHKEQPPEV